MSQEEGIKKALEDFGFEVEKLEERIGLKTPDFYATKDGDSFIIELKTKEMNSQTVKAMDVAFNEGRLHTSTIPLEHNGSFQKIIHKAKTQLEAPPVYTDPDAFNIAWFHCEGSDAETYMEIFENILYGKVYAADFEDNTSDIAWGCYFYKPIAMFLKYKDVIDGAVITMDGTIKVFPNILSEKYEKLQNSSMFITFKEGVNDPLKMEERGKALIIDDSLDRTNLHSEIIKKYKLKSFRTFPMNSYTISALTPKKL
jgi:hypothetical protein